MESAVEEGLGQDVGRRPAALSADMTNEVNVHQEIPPGRVVNPLPGGRIRGDDGSVGFVVPTVELAVPKAALELLSYPPPRHELGVILVLRGQQAWDACELAEVGRRVRNSIQVRQRVHVAVVTESMIGRQIHLPFCFASTTTGLVSSIEHGRRVIRGGWASEWR